MNRLAPVHAVITASLQAVADSVLQPTIVLAAIAFLLGGSNYQVAIFPVGAGAAWAFAPVLLLLAGSLMGRSYTVVFLAGVIRTGAIIAIGIIGLRIDDLSSSRIVSSLIVSYLVYQAASAVSAQAAPGLLLSGLPRSDRGNTFRRRAVASVIAAGVAALACWSVFRSGETFQHSVGLLLCLAAVSALASTWFLLNITGGASSTPSAQPQRLLSTIGGALQAAPFRRFISFKILLALAAAVDPFLIVFGFRELGLDVRYLGLAIVAYVAGQVVGNVTWPRWVQGHGPRIPFQVATLLRLVMLTWVIALPTLATSELYTDRFDDSTAAMQGFATSFALLGLAASAGAAANLRYVMDIAPRHAARGYILTSNLVTGICAFAPFGVAWLLQRYELERVLWGAIGMAIVALLASGLLIESRVHIRNASGSWRTRRQEPRVV
jgi:hypothetical protein